MSGFRSTRSGHALMFGVSVAIWRLVLDVSLDLLDWRWQAYNDGSLGVWIGPLWIDGWLIEKGAPR